MQKIYVRAKNTKEALEMLNIAKNPKRNVNFKLGILLGIYIGSISTTLVAIIFITLT
jgi:hypothetical protein